MTLAAPEGAADPQAGPHAGPRPGAPAVDRYPRLADGVRIRTEPFGYLAYVGDRDHFFAVDHVGARVIDAAQLGIRIAARDVPVAALLARYGIVATTGPRGYHHGVTLIGDFAAVPAVERPLVVNCFATAGCPLRCRYCYADDLMRRDRAAGTAEADPDRVARTATALPAMVAVITGGEPLSAPAGTRRLIDLLADRMALVLDTSGVGDLDALLPDLVRARVHLRVSLDSADPAVNDRLRPVARPHGTGSGASSGTAARAALAAARAAGVPTTVQTVVTTANHGLDALRRMRDDLVAAGVRNWVLHSLVPAGKAAAPRNAALRPGDDVRGTLADLVRDSTMADLPLNIRVTSPGPAGNSAIVVGGTGALYVERGPGGKVAVAGPDDPPDRVLAAFRRHVDPAGHAERYLNGSIRAYGSGLVARTLPVA